ncbi:hypothetical protein CSB08_00680 [Candidatus Gracilibacteria bacterium]|nr:MAG: hypothetical protein CSB08_00680 [Candidatus Gracilibacteria bacterium]PIE85755.1 MAG: hypothetical protein CSA08_00580 [Candidatus Gracilibacteria bacterium]
MKKTKQKVILLSIIFILLFLSGCGTSSNSIKSENNPKIENNKVDSVKKDETEKEQEDSAVVKNLYFNNVDYEELPLQEDE